MQSLRWQFRKPTQRTRAIPNQPNAEGIRLESLSLGKAPGVADARQANASLYISNVCGNCKYYNSSNNMCYKLSVVITEQTELISKCKEERFFEPSLKMRLGYATYKKIEELES
jgi:hypothetical protein